MSDDRYARQITFFGAEGQAKLARVRAAIVGNGGTGSHVIQQLAFLGVGDFSLVEYDVVDLTNLNRLVGAVPEDADNATRKVDVAERLIHAINPAAIVRKVSSGLFSATGFEAVRSADVVFGCVDKELPRFVLNEICQAYEIPFFDVATEIDPDTPLNFGGRIVCSVAADEGCLVCLGALDDEELRREQQSDSQREEERTIYGVRASMLKGSGPSVVSLNGVLASATVTEFMVHWTGVRAARRYVVYKGAFGVMSVVSDAPRPGCPYCTTGSLIRGKGEHANVERWLDELGTRDTVS
jgi:molybdopterin-synthase adenylyltransferase